MPDLFVICEAREVQEEDVRRFVLARQVEGAMVPWPILVTRKGGQFHAYENACPHDGKPLDGGQGDFLDEEGNFLQCKAHGDLFDIETGACFIGPAKGQSLTRLELVIDEGDICMIDEGLTDEDGMHLEEPDAHPEVMITSD
ncbi:Rieske 2Fe-2S domain-containing protein [Novosphingobium profundi]|uniref:Rieske (2Fe-2S) protein n=1 Tax=Novosphingobium profundi TaxID=1774954 RepID=UPI001BDB60BC|nr:Rieske 2Fe-2S domain-containing protein [Novosphingobium profundi]MBT0670181.1 Rieske 2Fe-2S domain-containing protein [Novosphingobium profundi]